MYCVRIVCDVCSKVHAFALIPAKSLVTGERDFYHVLLLTARIQSGYTHAWSSCPEHVQAGSSEMHERLTVHLVEGRSGLLCWGKVEESNTTPRMEAGW